VGGRLGRCPAAQQVGHVQHGQRQHREFEEYEHGRDAVPAVPSQRYQAQDGDGSADGYDGEGEREQFGHARTVLRRLRRNSHVDTPVRASAIGVGPNSSHMSTDRWHPV
jgi:hypothetical protein